MKTIPSDFFRFQVVKTYFYTNPLFRLVETYFLSSGNSILLFRAFFSDVRNHYWNYWEPNLKEKHFRARGNHFLWLFFLSEKTVFPYRGNVFFNKCFIPGSGNGFSGWYKPFFVYFFRDSCRRKVYFGLVETYFWTNPLFRLSEKDISLPWRPLLYLNVFFY